MKREDGASTDTIYENDVIRGSNSVKIRSSRAAVVCLVLLCVLLLTAVIVMGVYIHTNNTNYTQERDDLLTNITNLREERNELLTNNTNLTEERKELIINKNILMNAIKVLTEVDSREVFLLYPNGWIYYQSSLYYVSNVTKNWTESRRYCKERGADLIIINNREEQDFVKNITGGVEVYIGVTDSEVEDTWKWVDGSTLTSGFSSWASGGGYKEPNGGKDENCAFTVAVPREVFANLIGWIDIACTRAFQWICEKRFSQLILP